MHVAKAVSTRRSIRAFSDTPVALETIRRVLYQGRFAPSGCNFQPWEAIIFTGEPLRSLQRRLAETAPDEQDRGHRTRIDHRLASCSSGHSSPAI